MSNFIHFFERNTDANATNRGFLYQYLHTIREWLVLWKEKNESATIYCEYEDDIKYSSDSKTKYIQVKYYKSDITFNSEEVRKEIYNNFILEKKHSRDTIEFYFITNKATKDKTITNWDEYKRTDFSEHRDTIIKTIKDGIIEECTLKKTKELDKITKLKIAQSEKEQRHEEIEGYYAEVQKEIETFDWISFCKRINFEYRNQSIDDLITELLQSISKDVESMLPTKVVYARMLQEVAEKSGKDNPEERAIKYSSLYDIINEDEKDALQKISQFRTDVTAVGDELSLIKEILIDIKDDTANTTKKLDFLIEAHEKGQDRIEDMFNILMSKLNPTLNKTFDEVGLQGEAGQEYEKSIKVIESVQSSFNFDEAINRYLLLLTDILGQSVGNQVLFRIYNNLAICYINKDDFAMAEKYLDKIEKLEGITEKEKYYFAYFFYYIRQNKIPEAYEMICEAYRINNMYAKALINKLYLEAELGKSNISEIENIIFTGTGELKLSYETSEQLNHIYNTIGLIYFHFKIYDKAIFWFSKGKGDDKKDIVPILNIAGCHFCKAVEKSTEGKYIFRKDINYMELNKAIELYESILYSEEPNKLGDLIRSVSYNYMVATFLINDFEKSLKAFKYIDIERFAEDAQNIYRNKAICEQALNIKNPETYEKLTDEDKLFLLVLDLMKHKKYEDVISTIITHINKTETTKEIDKYYEILLEAFRQLGDWDNVSIYIKEAWGRGIKSPIINIYEALYYEIKRNIARGKEILEDIIKQGNDDYVFYDALIRFYQRNGFDAELYIILQDMFEQKHNYYQADKISFLDIYFDFFISKDKANEALEAFNKVSSEEIPELHYVRYKCFICRAMENYDVVAKESRKLYELSGNHKYLLNVFDAYIQCNELDKAEEILIQLERENYSDMAKLYMAYSDLHLLKGDIEESFKYACKAKDLRIDLPYDAVHHYFVMRSIRCQKEEGVKYMAEFVESYPKINKWVWTMKMIEEETSQFTEEFKKFVEDRGKFFQDTIRLFKNNAIGISTLSKTFDNNVMEVLEWRKYDGINVNTYNGAVGETEKELEYIANTVVVDALTLILLEELNRLDFLERFDSVLVTYSTITYLQVCILKAEHKGIRNILNYIRTALNMKITNADYEIRESLQDNYSMIYDSSILDSISVAIKGQHSFIYGDCKIKYDFVKLHNRFLSIYSLVTHLLNGSIINEKDFASIVLLMKKLKFEFTPFNGHVMYILAEENNFQINEDIKLFFDMKSSYNIESFFNVYGVFFKKLFEEKSESIAKDYLILYLRQFDRFYGKSVYYDYAYGRYKDYNSWEKSVSIKAYCKGALSIIPILVTHFGLKLTDYIDIAKKAMRNIPHYDIDDAIAKGIEKTGGKERKIS